MTGALRQAAAAPGARRIWENLFATVAADRAFSILSSRTAAEDGILIVAMFPP